MHVSFAPAFPPLHLVCVESYCCFSFLILLGDFLSKSCKFQPKTQGGPLGAGCVCVFGNAFACAVGPQRARTRQELRARTRQQQLLHFRSAGARGECNTDTCTQSGCAGLQVLATPSPSSVGSAFIIGPLQKRHWEGREERWY